MATLFFLAISGVSSRDVGNPHIVYEISVNKLIYREQQDVKPDSAGLFTLDEQTTGLNLSNILQKNCQHSGMW